MNQILSANFDLEKTLTSIKTLIYGLFVALEIDADVVNILAWLMLVDTVFGIIKSARLEKKISFKKLLWGMITKISILIVPMVLALVAKGLSFDFKWLVNAVLDILVVAEGFSIITNIVAIKEKKEIQNSDIITRLLYVIRQGMANILNRLMGNVESGQNNNSSEDE